MKKVYTEGRPPWYDARAKVQQPLVIGITGGSASGKTSVSRAIIDQLQLPWVVHLSMDSFYKNLQPADKALADHQDYNFDHPNAFDVPLMVETLKSLKEGKQVLVPSYDFKTHSRTTPVRMYGADVVVFEGILVLYDAAVRNLIDIKIFVDEDSDIRLARRLRRDIGERGRDVHGVLRQYERFVKPAYEDYILPTKQYADLIVPNAAVNAVAINLISSHIRTKLKERGAVFGPPPAKPLTEELDLSKFPNFHLLPSNNQVKSLHSIIRNASTDRGDFVFYSNRLARLLIEHALSRMPFRPKTVVTPTGSSYSGTELDVSLVGVSIMRAGEAMENPLRECCLGIPIVKLLIQSENKTPKLFYMDRVGELKGRRILLLDPVLATAATVIMAVRVLLDHGAEEESITFTPLFSSPEGICNLSYAFSKVTVVTSAVDDGLSDAGYLLPGVGNFGDRYFGTD